MLCGNLLYFANDIRNIIMPQRRKRILIAHMTGLIFRNRHIKHDKKIEEFYKNVNFIYRSVGDEL